MAAIRSVSTKPEILLRKSLWRRGLRYRVNDRKLPGSPDIVFPRYRTVVFVHGCFWHGHKGCGNYSLPKSNAEYWKSKVVGNQLRDQRVWRQLEARGWSVIVVWECQLKNAILDETIKIVADEIVKNGERFQLAFAKRRASRVAYHEERKDRKEKKAFLLTEIKHRMLEG